MSTSAERMARLRERQAAAAAEEPVLRDAALMVAPRLAALDVPEGDLPLLALALRAATVIDAMPDKDAVTMLPNHLGPLVRILADLEARAAKRRAAAKPAQLNPVQEMRVARRRARASS